MTTKRFWSCKFSTIISLSLSLSHNTPLKHISNSLSLSIYIYQLSSCIIYRPEESWKLFPTLETLKTSFFEYIRSINTFHIFYISICMISMEDTMFNLLRCIIDFFHKLSSANANIIFLLIGQNTCSSALHHRFYLIKYYRVGRTFGLAFRGNGSSESVGPENSQ